MPARGPSAPRNARATTIAAKSEHGSRPRVEADVTVLVIAWSPEEPERVGEIAVVPAKGAVQVLGRGPAEDEARVRFFRPRPGRLDVTEALASPGLSRRQLEVVAGPEGVEVRRVGKCPMRVNNVECDTATLHPGDTVRFRQELVLLCMRRPARLAPLRHFDAAAAGDFGEPDKLGILGESPAIWALRDTIAFAAKSDAHVLLVGESGTGKELAARAVYELSQSRKRRLVSRSAATLPSGLIDAELFGNVRNYPNPGMAERPGLIGEADGGFLFLDEIGELPSELQAHLLRVLDAAGEYQRLGEHVMRRSAFRLLAATNRDPSDLKHDLLARLSIRVELPPLAERREDIPLLVRNLVARASQRSPEVAARFVGHAANGRPDVRVDAKLIDALLRRDYQGNARELEALLWAAMAASEGEVIAWSQAAMRVGASDGSKRLGRESLPGRVRNAEPSEDEIRAALARAEGNVARAAKALGLSSRYALYRMMVKLGIEGQG